MIEVGEENGCENCGGFKEKWSKDRDVDVEQQDFDKVENTRKERTE